MSKRRISRKFLALNGQREFVLITARSQPLDLTRLQRSVIKGERCKVAPTVRLSSFPSTGEKHVEVFTKREIYSLLQVCVCVRARVLLTHPQLWLHWGWKLYRDEIKKVRAIAEKCSPTHIKAACLLSQRTVAEERMEAKKESKNLKVLLVNSSPTHSKH